MKNVLFIAPLLTLTACGQATLSKGTGTTSQSAPVASQTPSQPSVPVVQGVPTPAPVQTADQNVIAEPNSVTDSNTVNPNAANPNAPAVDANGVFNYKVIKLIQIGLNPNSYDSTGYVDGCNLLAGPASPYMYWRSGAVGLEDGFASVSNGIATWAQTSGTWTTVYTFYPDGSAQQLWRRSVKDPAGPCITVINSARVHIVEPLGYENVSNY